MARGRLISKSLGTSRKFHALLTTCGKLGEFSQVLFPLVVANTDDFGRMPGDAFTIKHVVLPTSPRPEADFDAALTAMQDVGMIDRYVVDGVVILQVIDFSTHQPGLHKRTKSAFPESPGDSGKFPGIPSQEKGREGKLREENLREGKGTERTTSHLSVGDDDGFEQFWAAYPKKKSKPDALKAWRKLNPTPDLQQTILDAIEVQRQSDDWTRSGGQFIPYPASWLNGKRWLDEGVEVSALSDTARHNIAAAEESERIIRAWEAERDE